MTTSGRSSLREGDWPIDAPGGLRSTVFGAWSRETITLFATRSDGHRLRGTYACALRPGPRDGARVPRVDDDAGHTAHALVVDVRVVGDDQDDVRLAHAFVGELDRSPNGA